MRQYFYFILGVFFLSSCAPMSGPSRQESPVDDASAMLQVGAALSGKELTEEQLRKLHLQMKDKEAQSAVESITQSLSNQSLSIKYCPSTGKRYSAHLETAPDCDQPLEWLEP